VQHVLPTVDLHQKAVDTLGEQIAMVKELLADADDEEEKIMYKAKLSDLRKRKLDRLDDIYNLTLTVHQQSVPCKDDGPLAASSSSSSS
jgi:hypothetical protein